MIYLLSLRVIYKIRHGKFGDFDPLPPRHAFVTMALTPSPLVTHDENFTEFYAIFNNN